MAHVAIDWRIAEVRSGSLRVPLSDKPGSFWARAFQEQLASIGDAAGDALWGEVKLDSQTIVVEGVEGGSEPALRQFLDDVVAGSNREAERLLFEASREQAGKAEEQLRQEGGDDEEMTRRFRDGE
jgi:hypothetical protein